MEMNQPSSSDPSRAPFPFGAGRDIGAAIFKLPLLQLVLRNIRTMPPPGQEDEPEVFEQPVVEPVILSRYGVDDFGRPRILSPLEVMLFALARPVVLAVTPGFGVAIALMESDKNTAPKPSISWQEATP
jgi:hypothetical protein